MGFRRLRSVTSEQAAAAGAEQQREERERAQARIQAQIEASASRFRELLEARLASGLPSSPEQLLELEREVHQIVAKECVDPVIGVVIQEAHDSPAVAERADELLRRRPYLYLQDSSATVGVDLLGGSTVRIRSPYYLQRPPRRAGRPRKRGRRGKAGNGLYPGLAVLGIHYHLTPAFASDVSRLTVMSTAQEAVETLRLRGIKVDRKKVLALTGQLARRGLEYRKWLQEQGAANKQRTSGGLKGRRLVIGTDGGRVRLRFPRRGRPRKSGRRGFNPEWKEPKVVIIYEIDAQGKKVDKGILRYDATMQDADGTFAILVAMLIELGAHEALEWIIVGDGAGWIWGRIKKLVDAVGYDVDKVTEVVDWFHAVEHLHGIADLLTGVTPKERKAWEKQMKTLLHNGKIDELISAIKVAARGSKNAKNIRKGTHYFKTHRERLQYKTFKSKSIPIGSGAVESCVRRVVNLRMKGNGIFWEPSNAEDMLHLRAQLLCGRWHSYVTTILQPKEFWVSCSAKVAPSDRKSRQITTPLRKAA